MGASSSSSSGGSVVVLFWLLVALACWISGRCIEATNGGNTMKPAPVAADLMRASPDLGSALPTATTASHKTTSTTLKSVSESQRRSQSRAGARPSRSGSRSHSAGPGTQAGKALSQPEALRIARRDGQNSGANLPELTLEEDTSESYLSDDTGLDSKGNPTLSSVLGDDSSPHTLTSTPEYESDGSEIVDSLSDTSTPASSSALQQQQATNSQHSDQLKAQQQQIAQLRSQLAAASSNSQMMQLQQQQQQQRPANFRNGGNTATVRSQQQHQALLADARNLLMAARQPVSLSGALGQQQGAAQPSSPVSTFNLNMGADRMMIKQRPQLDHQELATESIQHELMTSSRDLQPVGSHLQDHDNRRQAELMYAAAVAAAAAAQATGNGLDNNQQPTASYGGESTASIRQQPATCYSPLALLMVILATMLVTLLACLVTHLLIKHLSRHQFDLIANSKHLDTKLGSRGERRHFDHQQGSRASLWAAASAASSRDPQSRASSVLNMLINQRGQPADNNQPPSKHQHQQQAGCAFDNPYFREESWPTSSAPHNKARTNVPSTTFDDSALPPTTSGPLQADQLSTQHQAAPINLKAHQSASCSSDQLNFIESHISKLHSRQVTSSVKELSVLETSSAPGQVVDLTCAQQRARVIADPKEGDLVAVDISGHDFMGLGFDVCGNAQQGIFVRSVLSRGPARDSGCIQPGDRLKCINISFDQMTLQDACDILNSGSPYQLRLLIEKRAAPPKLADKLRQTAPILLRRNHRSHQSHLLQQHNYLSSANHHTHNSSSAGSSFTLKSCLRRLADMFSSADKKHSSSGQIDYRTSLGQFGVRSPVAGGCGEFLEQQPPMYLGSAAARRHFPQTRPDSASLFGSHINAASLGGHLATDTDDQEEEEADEDNEGAAPGETSSAGKLAEARLFKSSSSSSSSSSSVNVQGAPNQRLNKLTSHDLAARQHHTTLSATKPPHQHQLQHQSSHEAPPNRRQSVAALGETASASSQALEQTAAGYLEQTQSQPEMSRHIPAPHSDTFARAGKLGPAERRSDDLATRNKS